MRLVKHPADDSVTILVEAGKRALTVSLQELTEIRAEAGKLIEAHIKARAEELLNLTYVGQQHYEKSPTRRAYMEAYQQLAKLEIGGQIEMTISDDEGTEYVPDPLDFTDTRRNDAQGETDGKERQVAKV